MGTVGVRALTNLNLIILSEGLPMRTGQVATTENYANGDL